MATIVNRPGPTCTSDPERVDVTRIEDGVRLDTFNGAPVLTQAEARLVGLRLLEEADALGNYEPDPLISVVRVTLKRSILAQQTDEEADEERLHIAALLNALPGAVVQVYSSDGFYLYTPSVDDEAPILGDEDAGVKAHMAAGFYDKKG